jgi:hypothetical protein
MSLIGVQNTCNLLLEYDEKIISICEKNGHKFQVSALKESLLKINGIFEEVVSLNTILKQNCFSSEEELSDLTKAYYKVLSSEIYLTNFTVRYLQSHYSVLNLRILTDPLYVYNFSSI